ncbi:MAG: hypothetical protein KKH88_00010 [Nanoarchaeota archaeon]|nr:hypothetical protein [Nanoarchaeota archaeon]MBU1445145.1 hypothetical protein [Nanoarchaeota archaeon]MBU2420069.1 hypothetical protein [Nanoarchaeota archaeon]MBU2475572.1 hypothetical protein [Nanoarchaeota archaeon]MBU3940301.1 hypothetical protein [Nanoarchaeota archaeon]
MEDMFENEILCNKCGKKTEKVTILKDGFKVRALECPGCGKKWLHPLDLKEYQDFITLKNRDFQVKLRMVGNSFSVTIPREIIEFEEKFRQIEKEMDKMIHMSLQEPGKLTLFFKKDRGKEK